jgi:hypothetical protein
MNIQTSSVVAALLALAACTNTSSSPAPATSGAVAASTAGTAAGTTSGAAPAAPAATAATAATAASAASGGTAACTDKQFAACESGEACATRQGKLVNPRPCFDRAADACAALSCGANGCNIHHGTPNQILCAPNASTSSHMKRCGGFGNWACPEKMRCDGMDPNVDDAMGTCVPEP